MGKQVEILVQADMDENGTFEISTLSTGKRSMTDEQSDAAYLAAQNALHDSPERPIRVTRVVYDENGNELERNSSDPIHADISTQYGAYVAAMGAAGLKG